MLEWSRIALPPAPTARRPPSSGPIPKEIPLMCRLIWLALLAATCLGFARAASAQEPKPGRDWFEDTVDLGFRVKSPEGWSFVPAQPGETGSLGRFVAPNAQRMINPKSGLSWEYTMWLMLFDRREKPDDGKPRFGKAPADVAEWVDARLGQVAMRKLSEEPGRMGKFETVEYLFEGSLDNEYPVSMFVVLFKLRPDVEIALGFNGPGGRKFSSFERAARKMCGTLSLVEMDHRAAPAALSNSLRDKKRADLQAEVTKNPGWELHETPNYFVVSSNNDRAFIKELLERLEAIRKVYEETYPPSLAQELRSSALAKKREAEAAAGSTGEEDPEPSAEGQDPQAEDGAAEEGRTVSSRADPMERSRTSVVRVCKDDDEYRSYGGGENSAGYFSPMQEELVLYDAKATGGRDDTWSTLNHEAFHQYIFNFFGNLTPHYWYNEGTGDFYSGYAYKNGKFTLKAFDWRERLIQGMIREGPGAAKGYVPLEQFVRFDRAKYYDQTMVGDTRKASLNYAQGWALVWFLRTGKKNARCWDDAWDPILSTYLATLVETDDVDAALAAAYAGVDWQRFEDCWKEYILQ
jgi:hypothetical protein